MWVMALHRSIWNQTTSGLQTWCETITCMISKYKAEMFPFEHKGKNFWTGVNIFNSGLIPSQITADTCGAGKKFKEFENTT
jgi:hypothetical protein